MMMRAPSVKIVCDADAHLGVERDRLMVNAQQPAVDGIEAVGDVRKQDGARLFQQRREGVSKNLVRAVADEDLLGATP